MAYVKIDITPEEAAAIHRALEHYNADLYSQHREEADVKRLEELFRKLARH
jgi:hypothetical protein